VSSKKYVLAVVELYHFQGGHFADEDHDPIIVGLELGLFDHIYAEYGNVASDSVDVLVEELEVKSLTEKLHHLFETELVIQVSEGEVGISVVIGCATI